MPHVCTYIMTRGERQWHWKSQMRKLAKKDPGFVPKPMYLGSVKSHVRIPLHIFYIRIKTQF
jgi:hypothetical protein